MQVGTYATGACAWVLMGQVSTDEYQWLVVGSGGHRHGYSWRNRDENACRFTNDLAVGIACTGGYYWVRVSTGRSGESRRHADLVMT